MPDNLRINNHSKKFNEVYDIYFNEFFMPTYNKLLKLIKILWSIFKRMWTQNLHLYVYEMSHVLTKQVKNKQELLTGLSKSSVAEYREVFKIKLIIEL